MIVYSYLVIVSFYADFVQMLTIKKKKNPVPNLSVQSILNITLYMLAGWKNLFRIDIFD